MRVLAQVASAVESSYASSIRPSVGASTHLARSFQRPPAAAAASVAGCSPSSSHPSSSTPSSSSSAFFQGLSVKGSASRAPHQLKSSTRKRQLVVTAMAPAPVEVLVKAAVGQPDKLGDCPFSQRVLLTLEEKHLPYDAKFIDTSNKPEWFLQANPEGKVPVIKDEGKWVADSDVITELLEKKFPDPSLSAPPVEAGSKIFPSFVQFLSSKDPNDGKEQALLEQIESLDSHLKTSGPYLNGDKVTAADLALAPRLYHLKTALGYYKKWSIPEKYSTLLAYIDRLFARESFLKTKAPEEVVVKGWESKVNA